MAIGFKPVLSKLLFLGIVLLAVQLKKAAVEAAGTPGGGAASSGPPKVPCADSRQKFCTETIKCGATECSQQGTKDTGKPVATGYPFCKCSEALDTSSKDYKDAKCNPAKKESDESAETTNMDMPDFEMVTNEICIQKCAEVTTKNPGKTYSAFLCGSPGPSANCVCSPAATATAPDPNALEQNPDDMENVAMGMMTSIFKMFADYVESVVKVVLSIFNGMKNMDLPAMMTGMMDGVKDVMAAMKDGDTDGGNNSET